MSNELIILENKNPIKIPTAEELFAKDGSKDFLGEIGEMVKNYKPDIFDKESRAVVKAFSSNISKARTIANDMRKELVGDRKATLKLIDIEGKILQDGLAELRDEARKPLTDWEDAEKEHIRIRQERIAEMENTPNSLNGFSSNCQDLIEKLTTLYDFDWQNFAHKAKETYNEILGILQSNLAMDKQREKEKAELEKLRIEKEEWERKNREEKIAKDAARMAKREAEEVALVAKRKVAAAAKARVEKIEAEKRGAKERLKLANERRKEAEIKAKKDKEEAVIKERERGERERTKELEVIQKREENERHRTKINNEIVDALKSVFYECEKAGDLEQEKAIVIAIFNGTIPHVKINY